jgi:signal transduction histidine kinase
MDFNKILKILSDVKFLAHIPEDEQNKFIRDCKQINLKAGEPLFHEKDLGSSMYVVLSGEVSVYKGDTAIAKRRRGELFGELSLIESTPRSATVKSSANTSLLEITKEQFDSHFASNSKILLFLLKIIAKRFIVDINKMDSVYQGIKVHARELEESNSDLQRFAYIASHDLQEPLRKIMAFGDRLNRKAPQLDNEGKDYLSRMQTSAERMKRLIDDILKYSNVTAQENLFEHVDLKTIIDEVLLDLEDQIVKTCGKIKLNEMPSLEAIPFQMRQLFQNLISNSLKYHRKGVRPVVNITSSSIEGDQWNITIEDNGIGIKEKYFDRVFKMFERLHGRNSYEGTGIGLAICKKIVRRHGGKIALEKPAHEGTKINIILPVRQNLLELATTPS